MNRKILLGVSMALALGGALSAQTVTLPAAASIVGGAPFFSDVRAFNTSYTASLDVTATYRCFIGSPCPASRAADDLHARAPAVARLQRHGRVGLQRAEHGGRRRVRPLGSERSARRDEPPLLDGPDPDGRHVHPGPRQLVGLHVTTVLTSIRNRGDGGGFRTNVGVFNPEDFAVTVTFAIFDSAGVAIGAPVTVPVAAHSGAPGLRDFRASPGAPDRHGQRGRRVTATGEVFSYAAVIDNATTDPIFVTGAQDVPPQPITPGATATPTNTPPGGTATPTATPPAPTPTPTPPTGGTRTVNVGGGADDMRFIDQVSGTGTSTIPVGTTINWVWVGALPHSTTSEVTSAEQWDSGQHNGPHSFTHTFNAAGTFEYFCTVHGQLMSGTVTVTP